MIRLEPRLGSAGFVLQFNEFINLLLPLFWHFSIKIGKYKYFSIGNGALKQALLSINENPWMSRFMHPNA